MALKEEEVNFISAYYWDSLRKGLLAGETLQLDLDRMEQAYYDKNARTFEITKHISLLQLDPLALLKLKQERVCEFTLNEALFDYDFPGHYCRQIKSIAITFPALVGPYQSVSATLTQMSHQTLLEPDVKSAEYLLNPAGDMPLNIRADWRVNQQVALSRGVDDSGLFQLNFEDERYLPFESTGAVSSWRLELNGYQDQFDIHSLSDVIITLNYTAKQGGDNFANLVKTKLKPVEQAKIFSLATQFSSEWHGFMQAPSQGFVFTLQKADFPNMHTSSILGVYMHYELTEAGQSALGQRPLSLNGTITLKPNKFQEVSGLNISASGSTWTLKPVSESDASHILIYTIFKANC